MPPEQPAAVTTRQEFAGVAVQNTGDLQTTGAEARAAAEVQAGYVMARRFPRDEDDCRRLLQKESARPGVAETALYSRPVGRKDGKPLFATGFSIRFAEVAARIWGNMVISSRATFEDTFKTILTTKAVDLQTNFSVEVDTVIPKTIERKDSRGRVVRGQRLNSFNEPVFVVDSSEDEHLLRFRAERSKAWRDCALRLIPRDLLDECRALVEATVQNENAKDPDAARKRIFDRFGSLGILPSQVKEYLGKPVETLTSADLQELGVLYNGLKDGDFSWSDVIQMKDAPPEESGAPPSIKQTKLRERIMGAREPKAAEGTTE